MDIEISYLDDDSYNLRSMPLEPLLAFLIDQMDLPQATQVSLSFVTNEQIHVLNREYRAIDRPTDVLSFECDNVPFDDEDLSQLPEFVLGDIIIAPEVAKGQASEYGSTFQQEIELLTTHGFLHLCGYDHIEDEDAQEMEALERELLNEWRSNRS